MPKKTAPKPLTPGDEAYYFLRELWLHLVWHTKHLSEVEDLSQVRLEALGLHSWLKSEFEEYFNRNESR